MKFSTKDVSRFALATMLVGASPAFAQEQPAPSSTDAAQPEPVEQGDIVVTAQRREESLQRTPIAITAIGGEALQEQGVRNAVDLAVRVPSLQIGSSGQIYLRGVGTANVNEAADPTVASHIDGIYLARPQGVLAAGFYDVQRVEVLRGPQGTLYGRNATSGSINIISNKPGFENAGSVTAEIGNYDTLTTSGFANIAASDTLAFRAAFQTIRHDGYLESQSPLHPDGDSADSKSLRLSALWKPTETLSILLRGDLTSDGGITNIYGSKTRTLGAPEEGSVDGQSFPASNNSKFGGASIEVNLEVGPGMLTYLGGYRFANEHRNSEYLPFGGLALFNSKDRTIQQELRYSGDIGPVKFVAGLFHYDEKNDVDVRFQSGDQYFTFLQNPVRAKSLAVYGQATVEVASGLRLTGGLRYTKDKKSRDGVGLLQDLDFNTLSQFATNTASGKWSKVNWKVGAEYDIAPRVMVYANASSGYKAGGYFDGTGPNNTFAPEEILAYEAGIKSRFLDNRLTVNIDGFYYDYSNLQVSTYADVTNSGVLSQVTLNAGKARSYGLEADIQFAVTPTDRFDVTLGLLRAEYTSFFLPGGDQFSGSDVAVDYSGNALAKSPRTTINAGYEHDFALGGGTLNFRAQTHYESAKYLEYHNFAVTRQGGFTRSDVIMTYKPDDARWSLSAYVRNIENERPWIDLIPRTETVADGNVAPPRLYGARLTYNF